jgi:hypothetical protein
MGILVKILPPSNFFFLKEFFFYVYNLFSATYGGLKNQIFKKKFDWLAQSLASKGSKKHLLAKKH